MTSLEGFEPIAISPQKQDPGWKHCQLYIKTGDPKVELKKCLYCGKVFQGGGINRFKSHLAGRKGNGPICDQVPPHVRVSMLQCLDEKIASLRHRKSQMAVNPSRSFSELDNVFAENEVGGPNLMNQEEDVGMSVDNGIGVGVMV
ncbi:putative transcription factor/ chromatin remodeling BED-type(Zn) family [Rosa chinensis]|uniref:Putative transcription factor/ chromatin remodeling BED-type(Zn) family n=1 Tax=Rosa chinensis TaxID=74649 RepID=A0A2P6S0T1_ROSCH|nr:putative transcription factor/ chromatin remodeling BED-type(Zn) family [Rosa chinensis]